VNAHTVSDCCPLGITQPHRHLKTSCPMCGELVLDAVIARHEDPPPAITERARSLIARHKRYCKGTTGGNQ
jgi:hypothetical protein